MAKSRLGAAYELIYSKIAGSLPNLRPWHFQWLHTYYHNRALRKLLPTLHGKVLDVGCGQKPYRNWFTNVSEYIGIDVDEQSKADILINPETSWPFPDEYFDVILSTQVLEHVKDIKITVNEIHRVLKPDGIAIFSFPFLYNEHGAPWDFRRFTVYGAINLFPDWKVIYIRPLGKIGSTLALLCLNWIDFMMNKTFITRLVKGLFFPIWLTISFIINIVGLLMDYIDVTNAFYNNVLFVVRKPNDSKSVYMD